LLQRSHTITMEENLESPESPACCPLAAPLRLAPSAIHQTMPARRQERAARCNWTQWS